MKKEKNNKGFSLIELIIAVAILVVLSGLLAPQLIKYIEKSREAKDIQMLDSVYTAVNTALANETAYTDFIKETAKTTGNAYKLGSPISIETLVGDTDAFTKEVQSILGTYSAARFKFSSRSARENTASVYVTITESTNTTGTKFLSVEAYSGYSSGANKNAGFSVGN